MSAERRAAGEAAVSGDPFGEDFRSRLRRSDGNVADMLRMAFIKLGSPSDGMIVSQWDLGQMMNFPGRAHHRLHLISRELLHRDMNIYDLGDGTLRVISLGPWTREPGVHLHWDRMLKDMSEGDRELLRRPHRLKERIDGNTNPFKWEQGD